VSTEEKVPDLGINVAEKVKANEAFGKLERNLKGIGGTVHLIDEANKSEVVDAAWNLSKISKRPVIIVVRAT